MTTLRAAALRLADSLEQDYCSCHEGFKLRNRIDPQCESCQTKDWRNEAAAELRRLWAENEAIKAERDEDRRREYGYSQQVVDALTKERDALKAQRDALLEALEFCAGTSCATDANDVARAAIATVEGGNDESA